tara:strand:- start:2458 stop:3267 length:810 start_codon:yes stop_codon:yes gene_type:complete
MDFFDDSQICSSMPPRSGYQFYVSKYPVMNTNMTWAELFGNAGPLASEHNILFKSSMVMTDTGPFIDEFPNEFLGSSPTFTFYTDYIYLTLILFNAVGEDTPTVDPAMSVYMAVDSVDADPVEYSMGYYKEYLEAQLVLLFSQGHEMPSTPALQAGYNFPMWRAGGIRPERTLKADSLADWWHNLDGNFAEKTQTVSDLRQNYNFSKEMVAFDAAFGSATAAGNDLPDWIRLNALPSVISGPELSDFPIQIFPDSTQIAAGVAPIQIMT